MTPILYYSPFQSHSDYFPHNPEQSSTHKNIYFAGKKPTNQPKKSLSKGINLTKFISTSQKSFHSQQIRQNKSSFQPITTIYAPKINSTFKPNPTINFLHKASQTHLTVHRTFSTPLINQFNCLPSPLFVTRTNEHMKITNQNLFPKKNNPIIRLTSSPTIRYSMDSAQKNSSLNISQRSFRKIQYINPAEKISLKCNYREKMVVVSPIQKVTFPTRFPHINQKVLGSRLLSPKYQKKTIEKKENIYYQMEGAKAFVIGLQNNKAINQIKMTNTFRPISPLPIQRDSLVLRQQIYDTKRELKNNQKYIPSLKYSKSTAEEQESPYSSSERLQEEPYSDEQKRGLMNGEIRPLKNSIRSLWDSVEKCAESIIYENAEVSQPSIVEASSDQRTLKTSRVLGKDPYLTSFFGFKDQIEGLKEKTNE